MKWLDEPRGRPPGDDDVDRPTPHRSRKNRRRWCRGKVGVEHGPIEVRVTRWFLSLAQRWAERGYERKSCVRAEWHPTYWSCNHERYCGTCGKILQYGLGRDCPDWTPEVTLRRIKT